MINANASKITKNMLHKLREASLSEVEGVHDQYMDNKV